jgi:hypothetical protein
MGVGDESFALGERGERETANGDREYERENGDQQASQLNADRETRGNVGRIAAIMKPSVPIANVPSAR